MEELSSLKDKNPIDIFKDWLKTAEEKITAPHQANAMVLSTVYVKTDNDFSVSSRVVLLKEVRDGDLIFYTNYHSQKAWELRQASALNFYWPELARQVRFQGVTSKIPREQSVKYWNTRSWESQISQYISEQSEKLESRAVLEKKRQEAEKKFYGKQVPCPFHWGGYAFTPWKIEFWVEKPHRLHDRLVFEEKMFSLFSKRKWKTYLLYP